MRLRMLAAELRHELPRVDRMIDELGEARAAIVARSTDAESVAWRLAVYAAAALLETFYTGVEKAMRRVAVATGGAPDGAAWHRDLLSAMVVDVPRVRPALWSEDTARELERYLAFRHRFRNLYLFELDPTLLDALLSGAPLAWRRARAELEAFAGHLDALADALDP